MPDMCRACAPLPPPLGPYFARGQAASPVISHLVVSHKWPLSAPRALIYCLNISSAQQHLQKTSASAQKSPVGRPPSGAAPIALCRCTFDGFPSKVRTFEGTLSKVSCSCFHGALPCTFGRKCTLGASALSCLALSTESARWVPALCPALHFRPKVHAGCLRSTLPCTFDRKYAIGSSVLSCLSVFACIVLPCVAFLVESARWVASFYLALHFRSKVRTGYFRPVLPCTFGRKCMLGACALPCLALSTESARGVPANFLALLFRLRVRTWFFNAVLLVCFFIDILVMPCTFGRKCALGSFVPSRLALPVESAGMRSACDIKLT